MTPHVHRWRRGEAPDYLCECGAVARRNGSSGKLRIVARTDEERALLDRRYEIASEAWLVEDEGGWPGREGDRTPAVDEHLAGAREGDRVGKTHRHQWTEADEAALRDAVEVVFRSELPESVERRLSGWSAVAGRLLPDLMVTPDACRTRWGVLLEREREEERRKAEARARAEAEREEAQEAADVEAYASPPAGEPDAWEALAQRIATMEMEAADDLSAALHGLRADVGELDLRVRGLAEDVAGLLAEWRGR